MANEFKGLSQLDRDYDRLLDTLKRVIPNLTDDWNDFSDSDLGMFLLKTFCAIKDMQAYHFDKQSLEVYLPTVRERSNLMSILKLINYKMSSYKATKVTASHHFDKKPERGTVFTVNGNSNALPFVFLDRDGEYGEGYIILYQGTIAKFPDNEQTNVSLPSVDTAGNTIESGLLKSIAISEPNAKVAIDGTLFITEGSDNNLWDEWKEVDELSMSESESGDASTFTLYVDRDKRTYAQFYNTGALFNKINVKFNMLITEGAAGAISTGVTLADGTSAYQCTVTSVSLGSDPETIEYAREHSAAISSTMGRAVTISDYELLVRRWLSKNADSEYRTCSDFAVLTLDTYRNTGGLGIPDSRTINPLDLENYQIIIYSIVGDHEELSPGVYKYNLNPSTEKLSKYVDSVKMVGIKPYYNCDRGGGNKPLLKRVHIKLKGSYNVNSAEITRALSEYYSLTNDSFATTVKWADIYSILVSLYPKLRIGPNDITFTCTDDTNGETLGNPAGDAYKTEDIILHYNEAAVFGGFNLDRQ